MADPQRHYSFCLQIIKEQTRLDYAVSLQVWASRRRSVVVANRRNCQIRSNR